MNRLSQTQTDVLTHALLLMLEGRSFDLPKQVEHSWDKLKTLQKETSRHPVEVIREATLTLHRFGCFKSFEDRATPLSAAD